MNSILETKHLTKYYGTSKVVDDVNISILPGEIYGLIGKNGAGKTTIMKIALSLVAPSKGEVCLFGNSSSSKIKQQHRIGAMIENPAFYPYLSAKQNLIYYKKVSGMQQYCDIDKTLSIVGLEDAGEKKFRNFSLGMKQRLGLGLALLGNPELLILDEPINGLDPEGIKEIRDILINQNKEYGTSIFISSHILSELSQLATKFGVIHNGKLLDEITEKELEERENGNFIIEVDDVNKAIVILQSIDNTITCETINNNQLKINSMNISLSQINHTLLNNHIEVLSMEKNSVNLESYFLDLIGRS